MGMIFYWSDIGSHSVGKVIIQSVSCVSGPMRLHFVSLLLHRAGLMICGFQISVHSTEVCLQGTVSLLFLHIYGDADYDHFHICVDCISVWYWEVMKHVFPETFFLVVRDDAWEGYGDYSMVVLLSSLICSVKYTEMELVFGDSGCGVIAISFRNVMIKSWYSRGWCLFQSISGDMDLFHGYQSRASSGYWLLWSDYGCNMEWTLKSRCLCYDSAQRCCIGGYRCIVLFGSDMISENVEYTSKSTGECSFWKFFVYAALFNAWYFDENGFNTKTVSTMALWALSYLNGMFGCGHILIITMCRWYCLFWILCET